MVGEKIFQEEDFEAVEKQLQTEKRLENYFFAFLGAWTATIMGLMFYISAPYSWPKSNPRTPAQEQIDQELKQLNEIDPRAYFLSFNSSHLEK